MLVIGRGRESMELILENVRSFCDRHSIPLRPLTLLVGENSTGKTSLLAMLAHVQDPGFPSTRPAFNIHAFDLRRVLPPDVDYPIEFVFRNAFMELSKKSSQAGGLGASPERFIELSRLLRTSRRSVYALAPVRTKPRRTYDEYSDDFDPEGDHVPVILARLGEEDDDVRGPRIVKALNEF